jgi:hypothetical protein
MTAAWLRAILILPGNVLGTIPALLLWFTGCRWPEGDRWPWVLMGGTLVAAGLAMASTVRPGWAVED